MTSSATDGQGWLQPLPCYEEAMAKAEQDRIDFGIGRIRFVWDSDGIRYEHVPYQDVMLPAPPTSGEG